MTRVKSLAAVKHRKIRAKAKGFRNARSRRVKTAIEAVMHAGKYAYIGRRLKRRDLRSLWITRLSAASKDNGTSYSKLIASLKGSKVELDRKVLSEIAFKHPEVFAQIVKETK